MEMIAKTEDELYEMYQAQLRMQEARHDEISKALRILETKEEMLEDMGLEIRSFVGELPEQWESEDFHNEAEQFEEDCHEYHRRILSEIEEEREELQHGRRMLSEEEMNAGWNIPGIRS